MANATARQTGPECLLHEVPGRISLRNVPGRLPAAILCTMDAASITETLAGSLTVTPASETVVDEFLVTLDPHEDPQRLSLLKKWSAILVISSASMCVTCFSSIVSPPPFHMN